MVCAEVMPLVFEEDDVDEEAAEDDVVAVAAGVDVVLAAEVVGVGDWVVTGVVVALVAFAADLAAAAASAACETPVATTALSATPAMVAPPPAMAASRTGLDFLLVMPTRLAADASGPPHAFVKPVLSPVRTWLGHS